MLLFALIVAGAAFVIWQQEDFVAQEWMVSAPPTQVSTVAALRVAVRSQFAPQGDGAHDMGVNAGKKWSRWARVVTLGATPKWRLLWSRDGSLVALQQSALGVQSLKNALYTQAFDFRSNKNHTNAQIPPAAFSRQIEGLLKQRGGAVAGRETQRKLGVMRWQDRNLKDSF